MHAGLTRRRGRLLMDLSSKALIRGELLVPVNFTFVYKIGNSGLQKKALIYVFRLKIYVYTIAQKYISRRGF